MKKLRLRKIQRKFAKLVGLSPIEQEETRAIVREESNVIFAEERFTVLKGDPGEQGEKGTAGERGVAGARGGSGSIGEKGAKGIPGPDGRRGRVGVRGPEGDVGPRGRTGEKGDKGDPPEHEWKGTRLRFKKPDDTWGIWINLQGMAGGRGRAGFDGTGGHSVKEIWDSITLNGTDLVFARGAAGSLGEDVTVDLSSLAGGAVDVNNAQRIDEEDGGDTLYIGDAVPGTLDNASSWRIKRIKFVIDGDGDTDSVTEWAGGNDTRDKVWDDRLAETYT